MTVRRRNADFDEAGARAMTRVSRAVGLQITVLSSVLVLAVLVAAFAFVFAHIAPAKLLDPGRSHETTIDVGGVDILVAGIVIGAIAIILAGAMSWFATRRAVRPLGEALRIQRAFVADASHELRTPLAVLDARLQLMQRGLAPNDSSGETVAELRRDTKTLVEIVNDLLASAEMDGARQESSTSVALDPVVARAVDAMQVIATERSVSITREGSPSLGTRMPAASVQRCIVALLDNALGFSPPGSTIHVSVSEARCFVRLSVRDHGPGITGIKASRIFDRFAHSVDAVDGVGTTRTSFGIGLALVRDTVERFGGRVAVEHTSAAGTEISLLIPRAQLA